MNHWSFCFSIMAIMNLHATAGTASPQTPANTTTSSATSLAAPAAPAALSTGLDAWVGSWRGVVAGQVEIVITLLNGPRGLEAVVEIPAQGFVMPFDTVRITDGRITLELPRIPVRITGVLTTDGRVLEAVWSQGQDTPLSLTREEAAPPPVTDGKPISLALDVQLRTRPWLFRADGKMRLAWELLVSNMNRREVSLESIDIVDEKLGRVIQAVDGIPLLASIERPGQSNLVGLSRLRLKGGTTAVVYLWGDFDDERQAPSSVVHRITGVVSGHKLTTTAAPFIPQKSTLVFGQPLKGGTWLANNGPSHTSLHRRVLVTTNGRTMFPECHAIDWGRVDAAGNTFVGDPALLASYLAYGQEVLAVSNGTVVGTVDGIAEHTPQEPPPYEVTLDNIAGNSIILDIGGGRFVLYAHLKPGSLKVKKGDRVKRGQVIGLLGNSGNSSEPHLHFQVSDGPSVLSDDSVPYVFEAYTTSPADGNGQPVPHKNDLPVERDLVTFP
jgi:hypothetical protein